MKNIIRYQRAISSTLEWIITFFFFIILSTTILLVFLRYVFNTTIVGSNELIEYLFIYTTALGAAVSLGRRNHIKVTFFLDHLKGTVRKAVEVIGLLSVAYINGLLFLLSFSWIAQVGSTETPVLRLPQWSAMLIIPVSCALAVLYCLYDCVVILFLSGETIKEGETL